MARMKKFKSATGTFFSRKPVILLLLICNTLVVSPLQAQTARIKIDLDRTIGEVDKNIYGNFIEHLGRCVYQGIYDPGNPLSDEKGCRKDLMAALRELKPSIVRYPGGNFVSNYNWLDGVGPKSERPPRMELAWGTLETNQFGTNEFIEYAKAIDTEPYIAVNLGTGTIEEARRWVEYCNVKDGPYFAELRKKHGYPEPYNVKYWGLGNEMDGTWQMGHMSVENYVEKAREAAKLMQRTSPDIKLIAAGSANYRSGADPDHWNQTILEELKDVIDYIALHIYVGNPDNNYYNYISTPLIMEQRTRIVKGMVDRVMQTANRVNRQPIYIAWDEYNVCYRGVKGLEETYNLEDALVIAGFLNAFIRNADIIKMANLAQLVNVIAPVVTNENGMFKQTIFYPLQLFANNMYGTSLDVFVECKTYDTDKFFNGKDQLPSLQKNVPYLDVSATYNENEIILCVVNRNKDEAIATEIISQNGSFADKLEVYEFNGPNLKSENNFDKIEVKTSKKPSVKPNGNKITYTFQPHSLTMIKAKLTK